MRIRLVLFLVLLIILADGVLGVQQVAAATRIDALTVRVECATAPPTSRVMRRMEASINTVGQHILLGKTIVEVTQAHASYEKLIAEIFDRVLVGYSVESVNLTPGSNTQVQIKLIPWGGIVRQVQVKTSISGIAPAVIPLVEEDLSELDGQIREILLGLPIDAVDWAGSVVKQLVRENLAEKLPEFEVAIDMTPGTETQVHVSLIPVGTVVREVKLAMRSNTIPSVLLLKQADNVLQTARNMRGLPVAYIKKHQAQFSHIIHEAAINEGATRRYGLDYQLNMSVAEDTNIIIDANTSKYRIYVEGYMDIGRKDDATSGKLHAGRYISKKDELFLEVTLVPAKMNWEFTPGWANKLGDTTTGGFKYNLSKDRGIIWLEQVIAPKWSMRAERSLSGGYNEIGLRYKVHAFMGIEYVVNDEENYLRLVGNL